MSYPLAALITLSCIAWALGYYGIVTVEIERGTVPNTKDSRRDGRKSGPNV